MSFRHFSLRGDGLPMRMSLASPLRTAVGLPEMSNSAIALMGDKQLSVEPKTRSWPCRKITDLRRHGQPRLANAVPGQRNEFLILFEDLMVRTYMDRFGDYNGEHLKIENAVGADDNQIRARFNGTRFERLGFNGGPGRKRATGSSTSGRRCQFGANATFGVRLRHSRARRQSRGFWPACAARLTSICSVR